MLCVLWWIVVVVTHCAVCVEGVADLLSSVNIDLSSYSTELGRHLAGTVSQTLFLPLITAAAKLNH